MGWTCTLGRPAPRPGAQPSSDVLGRGADLVGIPVLCCGPSAAGWGSKAPSGWAEALQHGGCILQALPWGSPGSGRVALARARVQMGFQTGLSLLRSQDSQKQRPRWSEAENGHGCWLVPAPSALPQRPCALGQTVTCCGGMSHTTTKSLVFQREPGTAPVLVPWSPTPSTPSPCHRGGSWGWVFTLHHSPFLPPVSFFCLVRKKR